MFTPEGIFLWHDNETFKYINALKQYFYFVKNNTLGQFSDNVYIITLLSYDKQKKQPKWKQ